MQFEIKLTITEQWTNGGNGNIVIKNVTTNTLKNWNFTLKPTNFTFTNTWDAIINAVDPPGTIKFSPPTWNTSISPNTIFTSGFSYSFSGIAPKTLQVISSDPSIKIDDGNMAPPVIPPPNPPINPPPTLTSAKKVFAYFTEWSIYQREYQADMVPAKLLTHLLYAFMLPNPNQKDYDTLAANYPFPPKPYHHEIPEGTLVFQDDYAAGINIPKIQALKLINPNLKILVSIGGWTMSWTLSKIAADPILRTRLATSSAKFIVDKGFDGVDIDWEYPGKQGIGYNIVSDADPANFRLLLQELRIQLDKVSPNKHLELCCAVGCDPNVITNYRDLVPLLDHAMLMTYDFAGSWGNGGHMSGLYDHVGKSENKDFNVAAAVKNALLNGFPKEKIVVGSPMYGRGWKKIIPTDINQPIFGQSVAGPADSYSGAAGEPGLSSWRHLLSTIGNNNKRYFDEQAQAVYTFNTLTGVTWSYEDLSTVVFKSKYIIDNNLGGIMFWEISDDTRDGKNSLLVTAVNILNLITPIPTLVPPVIPLKIHVNITNENIVTDVIFKPGDTIIVNPTTQSIIIKPGASYIFNIET